MRKPILKIIRGSKLNLRPISRKSITTDSQNIVKWVADPDTSQALRYFSFFQGAITLGRQLQYFTQILNSSNDQMFVIETTTGEFLGTCGLHEIDWANDNLRIGIIIFNKNYWRRGYGTAALNLLLRFAFKTLKMNKVYLTARADNDLAIKIYKKLGFQEEGVMRSEYRVKGGVYIDLLMMSILAPEWKGVRNG